MYAGETVPVYAVMRFHRWLRMTKVVQHWIDLCSMGLEGYGSLHRRIQLSTLTKERGVLWVTMKTVT